MIANGAPSMLAMVARRARRAVRALLPFGPPIGVYVASALGEVKQARGIAEALRAQGFQVTSRWHDVYVLGEELVLDPVFHRTRLGENFDDLFQADMVVLWAAAGMPRAAFVETGWAQVLGMPILWVQSGSVGGCLADRSELVRVMQAASFHDIARGSLALAHEKLLGRNA